MKTEGEFKFKGLEKLIHEIPEIEVDVENFNTFYRIMNNIKIPIYGTIFSLENTEIRYYPDIKEINKDIKKVYEYLGRNDLITDFYCFDKLENVILNDFDLIKFDPNIINVNESGFVYVRNPIFYVEKSKRINLIGFTGTKRFKKEDYYSPLFYFNDKVLNNLDPNYIYFFDLEEFNGEN